MKTKNIFRMLLVAAALLLGANNVKADEIQVWPLNGDNTSSNPIVIPAQRFENKVSENTIIKVYCTEYTSYNGYYIFYITCGGENANFKDWYGNSWDTGVTYIHRDHYVNGSYDFTCSATTATLLSTKGLTIDGMMNIDITKVSIFNNGTQPSTTDPDTTEPDTTEPEQTIEYITATIRTTGKATFSNSSALNFSGITGMKAYIATAISNDQVTLTQVSGTVAANTGLVLIGNPGSFNIPKVSSGTSYNNNLLVAGNGNRLELSNSYTDYVLIQDETDGKAKFAEVWSSSALPAIPVGYAYLHIPSSSAGARHRSLSIVFDNGTTGISYINNEPSENAIYNLRGQRVENPTKGLYIINGKKVVIK